MAKIKAICFDLDGVYFTPKGKEEFNKWLMSFGLNEEQVKAFHWSSEIRSLMRGATANSEFFNFVRQTIGTEISDDEISQAWAAGYEINPEVRHAVLSARKQGYVTCVCTNNNAIRIDALEERFGFKADFDVFVSSHEVGETKPNQVIFEKLIEASGVEAEELLYSDDNADRLAGARELGIQTFVYHHFRQFIDELQTRGVNLVYEIKENREIH